MPVRIAVRNSPLRAREATLSSLAGTSSPATVSSNALGWSIRSRRYSPSSTEKSDSTTVSLCAEPVMPHSSRTDQVCVLSQRGQRQFRLLIGNKSAAGRDGLAHLPPKKFRTLHHTAPEHDHVGREKRHQVCHPIPEVAAFVLDGTCRPDIFRARGFANSLCCNVGQVGIVLRCILLKPTNHRGPCCERFPTTMKSAPTFRAGRINHVVSDLGVALVYTAVDLSVQDDAHADSRPDGYVDQARLVFPGAPAGFTQCRCICVVFDCYRYLEDSSQVFHWVFALPIREEIHLPDFSRDRIDWPRRTDTNSGDRRSRTSGRLS